MLAKVVEQKFGFRPSIINGETSASARSATSAKLTRQGTIDRFEATPGFSVIVMSPLAAGVGLNVTAANHVIHYSRHWNPAKEAQATDRAYRIGQENDVTVYYPLAVHPRNAYKTFDERLDELLARKRQLSDSSMFPTEQTEITPAELFDALRPEGLRDVSDEPLNVDGLDRLSVDAFRHAVELLFRKKGYNLTVNDDRHHHGIHLIARSDTEDVLVHLKQTSKVDFVSPAIRAQLGGSTTYYGGVLSPGFRTIFVTNGVVEDSARSEFASIAVQVLGREELANALGRFPVFRSELV